jgi:hypothetical protein
MHHLVFDVESIGLHGEAFAVGYVILNDEGTNVREGIFACDPKNARGTKESHEWVAENVPALPVDCESTGEMRLAFWALYQIMKRTYGDLLLWADCAWPVEARFLISCVEMDLPANEWNGPYPLHEIATLALARGLDPIGTFDRLPDELPAHHPLNDARQSARIVRQILGR